MGFLNEPAKVVKRAVIRMDVEVIAHVVAVIAQGRGGNRQQPERVHAQLLQIVQLRRQPRQIADAVAVAGVVTAAVGKGAHENFVEDRGLIPVC